MAKIRKFKHGKYYWVRFQKDHDWIIAQYFYNDEFQNHCWMIVGSEAEFQTNDFYRIGNQIKRNGNKSNDI